MRDSLVIWLCSRKGMDPADIIQGSSYDPEPVLEKLADMVGKHLDLSRLK